MKHQPEEPKTGVL